MTIKLQEAAIQALWHLGSDEDRARISALGLGWKTSARDCAAALREALKRPFLVNLQPTKGDE